MMTGASSDYVLEHLTDCTVFLLGTLRALRCHSLVGSLTATLVSSARLVLVACQCTVFPYTLAASCYLAAWPYTASPFQLNLIACSYQCTSVPVPSPPPPPWPGHGVLVCQRDLPPVVSLTPPAVAIIPAQVAQP